MSNEGNDISNSSNTADTNRNNNAPRINEEAVEFTPPTTENHEKVDNNKEGKQADETEHKTNDDGEHATMDVCTDVDTRDNVDVKQEDKEEAATSGSTGKTDTGEQQAETSDSGDTTDKTAKDKDTASNEDVPVVTNKSDLCAEDKTTVGSASEDNKPTPDSLGASANESSCSNGKTPSPGDSIYHVKWIYFKKKSVPIITQNENGPCPLLAILNVLLLQARVKIPANADIVTANQLMTYLGDCVLKNVPTGSDEDMAASARLNFEQNMQDAVAVMYKLQTGIDVNVRFTGVKDFEYTPECIIFDLLQISLYHGWLVDPQNIDEVKAVGTCSYNQLVEKIIREKGSDQTEVVSQALVAEQFLETSASQLTYHGLSELSSQLKDDELVVLFRNNHFITLYRHNNELFQLVTDQGLLHESNVVWETLSNVEGDCHFVDCDFRTYTKPEPVFNPVENPESHLDMDEQIEQDYMVALSMQQEQADHMAWAQVDPQQPVPQLSDLELAKSLQEEERQAAMAEQERAQQRQVQGPPRTPGNGNQRQPQRADSRESKKSDCCIL